MTRRPSSLEQYIGERIRRRRTRLGLTQEELAAAIGCSYQQVQKYESGANRVSAGTLLRIARRLEVPVDWFFLGFGDHDEDTPDPAPGAASSRRTVELVRAFEAIDDETVRAALTALARTVAERALPERQGAGNRSGRGKGAAVV